MPLLKFLGILFEYIIKMTFRIARVVNSPYDGSHVQPLVLISLQIIKLYSNVINSLNSAPLLALTLL